MFNGHKNESLLMWKAEKSSLSLFSHVQVIAFIPYSNSLLSLSLFHSKGAALTVGQPRGSDVPDAFHRTLKGFIVSEGG